MTTTVTEAVERAANLQSTYLRHLPAFYSESDFMGRFLMIFESIMGPLENTVDNLPYYFSPATTPVEFLDWLASWLNLALDEHLSGEQKRELIRSAAQLFQWRGTRRGLTEYLRLATGVTPRITEDFGGVAIGRQSLLGRNTVLGDGHHHVFTVTFETDDPLELDIHRIKYIIESEKPVHTAYRLVITRPEDTEVVTDNIPG